LSLVTSAATGFLKPASRKRRFARENWPATIGLGGKNNQAGLEDRPDSQWRSGNAERFNR
jgi:hypothetical protein